MKLLLNHYDRDDYQVDESLWLVQTSTHEAMGSAGLLIETLDGKVAQWRLVDGGAWTRADLLKAQAIFDSEEVEA